MGSGNVFVSARQSISVQAAYYDCECCGQREVFTQRFTTTTDATIASGKSPHFPFGPMASKMHFTLA